MSISRTVSLYLLLILLGLVAASCGRQDPVRPAGTVAVTISLNPAELSAQGAPVDDLGQSAITRAVLNIYRNGSPVRFDHSGHEDPAGDLDLILVASEPSRTFYLTPGTYTTSASPGKMTIITSWPKVKC